MRPFCSYNDKLVNLVRILTIVLLTVTAISAMVAGILFILDPSGLKMGMNTLYLQNSPFSSFLIPGIILFTVNGLMNAIVAVRVISNKNKYPLMVTVQGLLLSGWITFQVIMVKDFNALHLVMLCFGIALIVFGRYLSVHQRYSRYSGLTWR